jgi:hypothetical protein
MTMTEEARKVRNEYARKWRARNKDKIRQHQERYWEKVAKKAAQETA